MPEVVEEFTAPELSAGAALAEFGSVCATADDDVLYRIRPE